MSAIFGVMLITIGFFGGLAAICGLTSVILGGVSWNKCVLAASAVAEGAATSTNQLNVWLIIYGSLFMAFALFVIPLRAKYLDIAAEDDYDFSPEADRLPFLGMTYVILVFLQLVWCMAWIVYGGVLLFGSKAKYCKDSTMAGGMRTYRATLAFWILMLIGYPGAIWMAVEAVLFGAFE